ncbi:hypothetical protein OJF2_04310 [Aquisphaera giovannonii]|uniref:Effector-associated domain-containing protein n=1 Tax=Aquisphaera giovannonii TaxID=406548 RepID=A0A5B9VV37_9BACT|nr:serine protease [Aquisphaera giovannonii]QEH31964.1 hypothetical protein OJF2_04310 [Aquisphaera giovannonii]
MPYHIDGPESGKLSAAIADAVRAPTKLDQVLTTKLDDSVWNYAGLGSDYTDIRFELVKAYNSQWHIDKLMAALLEVAPDNGLLLDFAWRHRLVQRPPDRPSDPALGRDSLERMLDPARGFADPVAFLKRFGEIMNRVCRISVPHDKGTMYGTGFLIGDETILTNYHVMEPLVTKVPGADRKNVDLLFDFRTAPDGVATSPGVSFKLFDHDTDWLIDESRYADADLAVKPVDEVLKADRPEDRLDYAVLRVAGSPGGNPIGVKPVAGSPPRGSLPLLDRDDGPDLEPSAAIFIFQHPKAAALRLDWEKPAVLGVNTNRTRVLYNVNTEGGSSGSPCFNAKLDLVALHHVGGKDWPAQVPFLYNQGIPVSAIRRLLEKRGKLALVK